MVEFNKLLVIPYNKGIYLDVQVMDLPYFTDVYLDSITIDTQDTFKPDGISKTPAYTLKIEDNVKSLQMTIKDSDLLVPTVEGTMFFVYVTVKGTPAANTPCGLDEPTILAVCVDSYRIYRKGIEYIQETYNNCVVPKHFIDFILRYKAFEMCLKTRDFPLAITYWKGFWRTITKSGSSKCTCYG